MQFQQDFFFFDGRNFIDVRRELITSPTAVEAFEQAALSNMVKIQKTLLEEERSAYNASIDSSSMALSSSTQESKKKERPSPSSSPRLSLQGQNKQLYLVWSDQVGFDAVICEEKRVKHSSMTWFDLNHLDFQQSKTPWVLFTIQQFIKRPSARYSKLWSTKIQWSY